LMQVEFPERPGALRRFLGVVSPRWNVSLFHYRNTGNQSSQVLIGIQVPKADAADFDAGISTLDEFTFSELSGLARDVFSKFIQ
jgi:threonine dehydratase